MNLLWKSLTLGLLASVLLPSLSHASTISVPTNYLALNTGLVGWWTFDGPNMINNVADSSGQGFNGRLISFPATSSAVTQGIIGQALTFDGTSDYVEATSSNQALNITGPMTISAWIKFSSLPGRYENIVSKDSPGGESYWFGFSGATLMAELTSNGSTQVDCFSGSGVNAGKWYHVGFTWDGTNVQPYINGVASGSPCAFAGPVFSNPTSPLHIGNSTLFSSNQFPGAIDDVRIYNRALSATEMARLYNSVLPSKIGVSSAGPGTLGNGLVGWWTFDGKDTNWNTNTINDVSGNNNTGNLITFSTSTSPVPGKAGQALLFTGASGGNFVQAPSGMIGSGTITACAWINVSSSPATRFNYILSNTQFNFYVDTFSSPNDNLNYDNAGTNITSSGSFKANAWNHVCVTRNGTTINFYVNGVISGTPNQTSGTPATSVFNTDIGSYGTGAGTTFTGKIDDVRIYNRILSATEIAQLYTATAGNPISVSQVGPSTLNSGLVGWWTFDAKDTNWTANTVNDVSGSGNTGTLINMSTTTSPIFGKMGQALNFNGTNQGIDLGRPASLNLTNAFTISAWVKPQNAGSVRCVVVIGYCNTTSAREQIYMYITPGTSMSVKLAVYDTTGDKNVTTTNLWTVNAWHFLTGTFDGSVLSLYVDGSLYATTTAIGPLNSNVSAGDHYAIGYNVGGSNYNFPGSIDDVRVYNRALSAAEVTELYNLNK